MLCDLFMSLIYPATSGINYTCDFSERITTGAKDEHFSDKYFSLKFFSKVMDEQNPRQKMPGWKNESRQGFLGKLRQEKGMG